MTHRLRRALVVVALGLWTVAVGAGLHTLWSYENAPGPSAAAPAEWPADTEIPPPDGRPVLVLALHPQCPCSRATLSELARLVAHVPEPPRVHALIVAAPGFDESLVHSSLWSSAAAIPGVRVVRDEGAEARRFGARVSGQVLAYDGAGRLAFSGGLTGSRGHEGDNAGRTAVESLLAGRRHQRSTFVFGCLLFDGDGHAWTSADASAATTHPALPTTTSADFPSLRKGDR